MYSSVNTFCDIHCHMPCRHMNISNPTWKEVRHFVWFLNIQLSACEQSNFIRRVKQLKQFTVEFMIIMSRVSQPYICHEHHAI